MSDAMSFDADHVELELELEVHGDHPECDDQEHEPPAAPVEAAPNDNSKAEVVEMKPPDIRQPAGETDKPSPSSTTTSTPPFSRKGSRIFVTTSIDPGCKLWFRAA